MMNNNNNINKLWSELLSTVLKKTSHAYRWRNPHTFHGIDFSTIKSGLQKEVRRGQTENALRLAIEADGSFVGIPKAKGKRTNVMNRLLLMTSEDVCLASPHLPKYIWFFYNQYMNAQDQWPVQRQALVKIVQLLATQPKSRMISDIAAVYGKDYKIPYAKQWHPEFFAVLDDDSKTYQETVLVQARSDVAFWSWLQRYRESIKDYLYEHQLCWLEKLLVLTHMEHDAAFHVLQKHFLNNTENPLRKPFIWLNRKRSNKLYLLWKVLLAYNRQFCSASFQKSLLALAQMYDSRRQNRESWIFLYHGLSYLVWRKKILKIPKIQVHPDLSQQAMFELYQKVLLGPNQPVIKPYFIDQHTVLGKRKGSTKIQFALEGARVCNEAEYLRNDVYRQLYISGYCHFEPKRKKVKVRQKKTGKEVTKTLTMDAINSKLPPLENWQQFMKPITEQHIPTESEMFQHPVRAQLLTGRNRPDVWYACHSNTPVVYKGPYLSAQIPSLAAAIHMMRIKQHYQGLEVIPCQVLYAVPTPVGELPLDVRNPANFGSRCQIDETNRQPYPFLVMRDVARPANLLCYPTQTKSSKCWPETKIADISTSSLGRVPSWSNPDMSSIAQRNYLLALLHSYIWQVTDTCARNFIWIPSKELVYRVDEESFGAPQALSHLYKKPLKASAKPWFQRALKQHWKFLSETLHVWKQLPEQVQPGWVRANIESIVESPENILKLL